MPEPPCAARHGTFFCALQGPIHAAGGPAGCAVPVRGGRAADPACGAAVAGGGRGRGRAYTPTAAYLTSDGPEALAERLGDYDFVDAWQTRQAATAAAVARLSSMSMVVYILILFGGGLACIVIYNLGIMSFFEQLRSLATLMVLGFYEKEIKTLQLSENIIFAVCGILLGIPLGVSLNRMILVSITTMPLMEATRPASLALSCAVTLLFALAVNVVIGRKMREIDMLGALKSVE